MANAIKWQEQTAAATSLHQWLECDAAQFQDLIDDGIDLDLVHRVYVDFYAPPPIAKNLAADLKRSGWEIAVYGSTAEADGSRVSDSDFVQARMDRVWRSDELRTLTPRLYARSALFGAVYDGWFLIPIAEDEGTADVSAPEA